MEEILGIARRILHALILLVAVIVLNFVLMRLAPGDVAQVIAGEMGGVTEEILADIRAQYGLDKSIAEQLFIFLGRFARLDFGESYFYNQPVLKLIFGRVPATLLLVLSALLFSTSIGFISLPAPWIGAQLWERFSPQTPFVVPLVATVALLPIMWFKFKLPAGRRAAAEMEALDT